MTDALILIDIQNDYFPGGAMALCGAAEAGEKAGMILARFRERGAPVFHIQHIANRPGATFFLPDTKGAHIHDSVRPAPGEPVLVKHFPNSFRETGLLEALSARDVASLTVCGMMTHMCVDATVRAAFDLGYPVTLVHDACATRDLAFGDRTVAAADVHAAFLAALGAVYATIADARTLAAS